MFAEVVLQRCCCIQLNGDIDTVAIAVCYLSNALPLQCVDLSPNPTPNPTPNKGVMDDYWPSGFKRDKPYTVQHDGRYQVRGGRSVGGRVGDWVSGRVGA